MLCSELILLFIIDPTLYYCVTDQYWFLCLCMMQAELSKSDINKARDRTSNLSLSLSAGLLFSARTQVKSRSVSYVAVAAVCFLCVIIIVKQHHFTL